MGKKGGLTVDGEVVRVWVTPVDRRVEEEERERERVCACECASC